jgi:hypothetical protein
LNFEKENWKNFVVDIEARLLVPGVVSKFAKMVGLP